MLNCSKRRGGGEQGSRRAGRQEGGSKLHVPTRRYSPVHGLSHFRPGTIENSSETPILRVGEWPSWLHRRWLLQLKKFVQRINNGRRTTVSKCRVYLATNKASTRRYSLGPERRVPSFSHSYRSPLPSPLSLRSPLSRYLHE